MASSVRTIASVLPLYGFMGGVERRGGCILITGHWDKLRTGHIIFNDY